MLNVEVIEEISNKNICLRKIISSDASFFFESMKEKQLIKYLSLGPLRDLTHSKRLLKNYLKYWDDYLQFNYIIELSSNNKKKKSVGSISLWNLSWLHRRASIGVWVNSKYWNQGIGKDALNMIKLIGFNHLKVHRLEAHIAIENKRSINLFKKAGFIEEGILRGYLNFRGTYHNAVLLACVSKELI